ncbi:MAG: hypothetical protein HYY37_05540 [Candidatus Aenigmarchaeota archaeon]|nr:hypothetical protein [Candidatus Aenigmarchaeota archaeon]
MVSGRSAALFVISTLIGLVLPLAILAVALQPAFSADFYKDGFEKYNAYSRLRTEIVKEDPRLAPFVTEQSLREAFVDLFDRAFAYIRAETNNLSTESKGSPVQLSEMKPTLDQGREAYRVYNSGLLLIGVVALLLLVLMVALTRKSKKTMTKWVGMTLLFAGIGGIIAVFIVQAEVQQLLQPSEPNSVDSILADVSISIAKDLIAVSMSALMVYSVIFTAVGAALALYSWKLAAAPEEKTPDDGRRKKPASGKQLQK